VRQLFLSQIEVEAQAACDRVPLSGAPRIDTAAAVERALRGFEARAFAVLVDGRHMQRLDDEVTVRRNTRCVRLVPLAGG
jgi:hypothetical protein